MEIGTTLILSFVLWCLGAAEDDWVKLEPSPGPILAPFGSTVNFNCTTSRNFTISKWNFLFSSTKSSDSSYLLQAENMTGGEFVLSSDNSTHLDLLQEKGINVTSASDSFSEVFVEASKATLGLCFVECEAANSSDTDLSTIARQGVNVTVYVYGPPPCPTHFTLVELGVNCMVLHWYSSFCLEGANLHFTLAVVTLGHYFISIQTIKSILNTYYVYSLDGHSSTCELYLFQVTAVNDAGEGLPSGVIVRNLPSLPGVSRLRSSVQHSLTKTPLGVALSLGFYGATTCADHPVLLYYLLLHNLDTQTLEVQIILGVEDVSTYLEENSRYLYYIFASNSIGVMGTKGIEIVTTDIQEVLVTVTDCAYNIQCVYLNDSNITGCVYLLVSGVEGAENVTGVIERADPDGVVVVEVESVGCHDQVFACPLDEVHNLTNLTLPSANTSLCISKSIPLSTQCPYLQMFDGFDGPTFTLLITVSVVLPFLPLFWVFCLIYTGLLDPCSCRSVWVCCFSDEVGYRELLSSDGRIEEVEEEIKRIGGWESPMSTSDEEADKNLLSVYHGYPVPLCISPPPSPASSLDVPRIRVQTPEGAADRLMSGSSHLPPRPRYIDLHQHLGSGRSRGGSAASERGHPFFGQETSREEMACISFRQPPKDFTGSGWRAEEKVLYYTPQSATSDFSKQDGKFLRVTLKPPPKYLVFIRGSQRKVVCYNPASLRDSESSKLTQQRIVYVIFRPSPMAAKDSQSGAQKIQLPPPVDQLLSMKVIQQMRPYSVQPSPSHYTDLLHRTRGSGIVLHKEQGDDTSAIHTAEQEVPLTVHSLLTSDDTEVPPVTPKSGISSPLLKAVFIKHPSSVPRPVSPQGRTLAPPPVVPQPTTSQVTPQDADTSPLTTESMPMPHLNLPRIVMHSPEDPIDPSVLPANRRSSEALGSGPLEVPEWEQVMRRRRRLTPHRQLKRLSREVRKGGYTTPKRVPSLRNSSKLKSDRRQEPSMQLLFLPSLPPCRNTSVADGISNTSDVSGTSHASDAGAMSNTSDISGTSCVSDASGMSRASDTSGTSRASDAGDTSTTSETGHSLGSPNYSDKTSDVAGSCSNKTFASDGKRKKQRKRLKRMSSSDKYVCFEGSEEDKEDKNNFQAKLLRNISVPNVLVEETKPESPLSKSTKRKSLGDDSATEPTSHDQPIRIRPVLKKHCPSSTKVLLVATEGDRVQIGIPVTLCHNKPN